MSLIRQLTNHSSLTSESELKQLISSDRVSVVYIHATARSGSTIAKIVLAQLADLAIHQPFRGTLQKHSFPIKSQQHINNLIPLYLDPLYANDRVYLPNFQKLDDCTKTGLVTTQTFLAYAIALFNLNRTINRFFLLLQTSIEEKAQKKQGSIK